jgi:hypothetical protein
MSQPETDVIAVAQALVRDQQLPKAQRLLVEYIKQHPNSEQAWYVLSTAVDDPRKQIECLQRVLRINPANTEAQARLMKVMAGPAVSPPAASPPVPPPPVVDRASTTSQPPLSEPAPYTPPTSTPAPKAEPTPISAPPPPEPMVPEVEESIASASAIDSDLANLRTKAKFVNAQRPRKRGPRIILLLLLVLLAAAVGVRLLLNSFMQAANPPTPVPAEALAPTNTPVSTPTPTVTPTPSITPTRYPPTWTPTAAPTTPPTRTPTPLPPLNADVQAEVLRVRDQVAAVRALTTSVEIPTALLPPELLETSLRSVLDIQQRQPQLINQARGLAALGLIRPGFDLSRAVMNRFAENAGGFYLPWQNVVNLVTEKFGDTDRIVDAHQTAHALLNQRFDFSTWELYPVCTRGEDACQARQALVEGDTALTTDRWLEKYGAKLDKNALPNYQALPPAVADPAAPSFVANDVAFRSEYGRKFIEALYQGGGWATVNKAYANLPVSTEQIMHPEKFIEGEAPIEVAAVPVSQTFGDEWQIVVDETLGEWRTYQLLAAGVDETARLSAATAQKAAAGWGGDRYRVYYDPKRDQSALVLEWAWDTAQDATEFQQAMSAYLDLRFRGAKSPEAPQNCWTANRQTTCLFAIEQGTLWVLTPTFDMIDRLRQAYPAFQ